MDGPCHPLAHAQLHRGQRQEIASGADNFLSLQGRRRTRPLHPECYATSLFRLSNKRKVATWPCLHITIPTSLPANPFALVSISFSFFVSLNTFVCITSRLKKGFRCIIMRISGITHGGSAAVHGLIIKL